MSEGPPASQAAVPPPVAKLVERFGEHADAYHAGRYNETQLRREFVDPLFKALGWDVDNSRGYAEAYKDVIHEDAIKVGGATKAPDYCFRIGGVRKFFVEAKKPSVDIKSDPGPAFQLRRYAWSAKLPLSILTDFEELAVYDCRVRPVKTDKPSKARTLYIRYDELVRRWGELASVFAREAILKGSFDKYVESAGRKRGTAEVDDAFLAEIEQWRETLARNFALRNSQLTQRELNFAVQRAIDGIVFLRICEDRGIEPYGTLLALTNGANVYERLFERFRRADERYNSGLFHFQQERGRPEAPDELTPTLTLDDRPLRDILARLYYPESPYEFSVLPADILGQVYEQFLGKVIRLTKAHRAVVEAKPEVRKAGGVYYTPTYIVDYIVKHTVGKLVEGKTPQEVGGLTPRYRPSTAKGVRALAVVDPACGSGSFLLGAYQFLLAWYRDRYVEDAPQAHAAGREPRLFQHASGEWRLTTGERKRILLSHIHGVDIDSQAVEVTKLSLLLKVLEGESDETIGANLRLFHERALPDLAANIKCGNSLIGPDFYEGRQMSMFDEEQRLRVNVFDWSAEFPKIMATGGFDAVIGNPPYLSFSGRQAVRLDPRVKEYFDEHYQDASWHTAHGLFILRALELSRGCVSFIVPGQVAHLQGYAGIRLAVSGWSALVEVRDWGENVFGAVVTPALTFLADLAHTGPTTLKSLSGHETTGELRGDDAWLPASPHRALLEKLRGQSAPLPSAYADPGVHTGNCSKKLILPAGQAGHDTAPVLEGKLVRRYVCRKPTKALRLGYEPAEGEYFTIRPERRYSDAPFVIRQTAAYPIIGPRRHAVYFRNSLLALCPPEDGRDVRFVAALLNSRLIRYAYTASVKEAGQKAFPQVKVKSLRALPIRAIDFADPHDKAIHDRLTEAADRMIDLHDRLDRAAAPCDHDTVERRIRALDSEIDRLVYGLYGLTEEEVAQVESSLGQREGDSGGR